MPADNPRIQPSFEWADTDELPVFAVNQVLSEIIGIDEIVVTLGHTGSIRKRGSAELLGDQPEHAVSLPVRGVARIGLTSKRLGELIEVLQTTKATHELLVERSMGLEDGGA